MSCVCFAALIHKTSASGDDSFNLVAYLLHPSRYNPSLIPHSSEPVTVNIDMALNMIIDLVILSLISYLLFISPFYILHSMHSSV